MKKLLKILGLLLLLVLAVPVAIIGATFVGNPEIPDGRELEGGTRVIKDGYTTAFMIDAGDKSVALIDAGNDPSGKAILAELSRRGLGPDAVKTIFLTHGHPDHVAACAKFPNAQVMALAEEVPVAEGKARAKGPLPSLFPPADNHVHVTRALKDGETVQVGNLAVRVFSVPGHTAGSAVYLARGTLFFGDAAGSRKDGTLVPAAWIFSDDVDQSRASLKALARRLEPEAAQVKTLAFAHTGVLPGFAPLGAFARAN